MAVSLSLLRPRSRCSSTCEEGGSTKIPDGSKPPAPHLPGALDVDHEHHILARREQALGVAPAPVP